MDKKQAQTIIKETFETSFDKDRFTNFIVNLFNLKTEQIEHKHPYSGNFIPDSYEQSISTLERIAKYTDGEHKIDILIVKLKKETSIERARTMQRNFTAWYLNGSRGGELKDAALTAFVSPNEEDWRFSLVKMDYRFEEGRNGRMKIKEEFTPARRWSFLVGANENSHTAQGQLVDILADDEKSPTLAQLEEAFNIEKVTREFFEKYRELFLWTKETLDDVVKKDKKIKADFEDKDVNTVDFSKKLLGQIVFLYFLQKKGWFGVKRDADWGTGPKNFLRELFEGKHGTYKNFFNDILEPLFYEALARERDEDFYSHFNCKIPFLNGGLFDPINNYDWVHTDILLPNDLFSNAYKTKEGDTGNGILDIFDRYNFTVKEDEPLEKEVAVDPEMLGKVFENLLEVKDRKSKGTYYTPREIVHYMCQQSLINYLTTELESKVSKEDIETLIKYGEQVGENEATVEAKGRETDTYSYKLSESIRQNAKLVDEKLASIKVCDPAIGSGAFPVGMMGEVVKTRNVVSAYIKNPNRTIYNFKRECIEKSLYGVDIDPSAVEIAKLRLWLSLVVDEEDIKQIKPLPNLDYKIVCGNSLLGVEKNLFNQRLFEELERLKPLLFNETIPKKKQEYKKQIDEIITQITDGHKEFDFEVYFSEIFHEKKGFDVVIANPPYLKERDNKEVFRVVNNSDFGKKYHQGKMDYWYYFLHKAIDLSKRDGTISYITSRYWLNSSGARKLIQRIQTELSFINIIDIGKLKVFDEVSGHHMVAVYQKNSLVDKFVYKKLENDISDIDKCSNTENVKIQTLSNKKIFQNNEIIFEKDDLVLKEVIKLDEIADISQGVVQNPDKVSRKASEKYGLIEREGVFVLTKKEYAFLPALLRKEKQFIRSFYDERDIGKYFFNKNNKKYLIYLTRSNCSNIQECPNLKGHLIKYKKIMDARRETKKGTIKWFQLHWPREERYFESAKIVIPSMFKEPSATFIAESSYFGLSTNLVISKDQKFNLKYLLAIINSKFALNWFYKHGKKRGSGLDIGVDRLRSFPIKKAANDEQKPFVELVDKIILITKNSDYLESEIKQAKVKEYECQIDQMVYKLYEITPEEIKIVEESIK